MQLPYPRRGARAVVSGTGKGMQPVHPDRPANAAVPNIDDYAVIGCGRGVALIANGSLDWCALPDLDSPPLFDRLLDAEGGSIAIDTVLPCDISQRYLPDTLVLETSMTTAGGCLRITDFMMSDAALFHGKVVAPTANGPTLIRLIEAISGRVDVNIRVRFARFGNEQVPCEAIEYGVRRGEDHVLSDIFLHVNEAGATALTALAAGERVCLAVTRHSGGHVLTTLQQAVMSRDTVCTQWRQWLAISRYRGGHGKAVHRSAQILKLLIHAPTGAMAAAGTTSLPEILGGSGNWDYRFSWIRDSTLAMSVLASLGYHDEPRAFLDFVRRYVIGKVLPSQIVYGLRGETDLVEEEHWRLGGFAHSRPVRTGNAAYLQRQFDVFGELLDWLYACHCAGEPLGVELIEAIRRTGEHVATHWSEPCYDFWERRQQPAHHVYSKVMCWVALDRAGRLLGDADWYASTMSALVEQVHAHGIAPAGYLRQRYDQDDVGALALRIPLSGFPLPPGCFEATVREVEAQLLNAHGVYRYLPEQNAEGEGSFVACGFWLVDALLWIGRHADAQRYFAWLLAQASPLGIYAEEIDAHSGHHLGNVPQALSHLAVIHSAVLLELFSRYGQEGIAGPLANRLQRIQNMFDTASSAAPRTV